MQLLLFIRIVIDIVVQIRSRSHESDPRPIADLLREDAYLALCTRREREDQVLIDTHFPIEFTTSLRIYGAVV